MCRRGGLWCGIPTESQRAPLSVASVSDQGHEPLAAVSLQASAPSCRYRLRQSTNCFRMGVQVAGTHCAASRPAACEHAAACVRAICWNADDSARRTHAVHRRHCWQRVPSALGRSTTCKPALVSCRARRARRYARQVRLRAPKGASRSQVPSQRCLSCKHPMRVLRRGPGLMAAMARA